MATSTTEGTTSIVVPVNMADEVGFKTSDLEEIGGGYSQYGFLRKPNPSPTYIEAEVLTSVPTQQGWVGMRYGRSG